MNTILDKLHYIRTKNLMKTFFIQVVQSWQTLHVEKSGEATFVITKYFPRHFLMSPDTSLTILTGLCSFGKMWKVNGNTEKYNRENVNLIHFGWLPKLFLLDSIEKKSISALLSRLRGMEHQSFFNTTTQLIKCEQGPYLGHRTSNSASSSKFYHWALLLALVSHSSIFTFACLVCGASVAICLTQRPSYCLVLRMVLECELGVSLWHFCCRGNRIKWDTNTYFTRAVCRVQI